VRKVATLTLIKVSKMSKVKRKLTFIEVKFDKGGNLLPAKRPRHHSNAKKESKSDVCSPTATNTSPFRALQTGLWTPVAPKRFAETPETCFKNVQSATSSETPSSLTPIGFSVIGFSASKRSSPRKPLKCK